VGRFTYRGNVNKHVYFVLVTAWYVLCFVNATSTRMDRLPGELMFLSDVAVSVSSRRHHPGWGVSRSPVYMCACLPACIRLDIAISLLQHGWGSLGRDNITPAGSLNTISAHTCGVRWAEPG
jgi:hypothetical protein